MPEPLIRLQIHTPRATR